jgi:NAD+--asparagine ADP-ribosyltransferase
MYSLRQRSSFAIATILYVGLKCEEAGSAVSDLQHQLREHAEKIGKPPTTLS